MAKEINITYHYDKIADILYIDFGSNEPCFTEDIDGFVMFEIGCFSNLPRVRRIISPKTNKLQNVKIITQLGKKCRDLMENGAEQIHSSESTLQTALEKTLNQALADVN